MEKYQKKLAIGVVAVAILAIMIGLPPMKVILGGLGALLGVVMMSAFNTPP